MDKKEIYEHLAKIYLDASSKKKKRGKPFPKFVKNLSIAGVAAIFILGAVSFSTYRKNKPFNSDFSLVLLTETAKINFNFDPAKKEIFKLALNKLNVGRFKGLAFSVRKTNFNDNISLRVEFTNVFNERSEIYIKDIPYKWQEYKVNLSEFRDINDWSEMTHLCFVVEEWNAREKNGVVYIDNVNLLK